MLEFDGLHKSFGDNHVLDGVSFTVAPGSMFGFCGSNGAGKTTTMRIAMGLVRADAGEVRWRGRPLDQDARRRDRLHAGGARPLPEDEGRRAGRLLRPAARARTPPRHAGAAERVDRAAGPRRPPRRRRSRSCRWATSSASSSPPPSSAGPRCSSSTSRSPASTRSASTPSPRRCSSRCRRRRARRLLQPPARPRRAALRLRRHPRPRPHGRHRHRRGAAPPGDRPAAARRRPRRRPALGRASCPASGSSPSRPATPCSSSPTTPTTRRCSPRRCAPAGSRHFAWQQPTLVELFREAVAAPTAQEVAA